MKYVIVINFMTKKIYIKKMYFFYQNSMDDYLLFIVHYYDVKR
jgi:hypothetical protein